MVKVEIINAGDTVHALVVHLSEPLPDESVFFTPTNYCLQFGVLIHPEGYSEKVHYHKENERVITGADQMLYLTKGNLSVDFFDPEGNLIKTYILGIGDIMLLKDGPHRIRVNRDSVAITAKLGPYRGENEDKVIVGE